MFEKNVGTTDKIVRIVLAIALFAAGYMYITPPLQYVAYLFGVIFLLTAILGTCGLYSLLGINTNK